MGGRNWQHLNIRAYFGGTSLSLNASRSPPPTLTSQVCTPHYTPTPQPRLVHWRAKKLARSPLPNWSSWESGTGLECLLNPGSVLNGVPLRGLSVCFHSRLACRASEREGRAGSAAPLGAPPLSTPQGAKAASACG